MPEPVAQVLVASKSTLMVVTNVIQDQRVAITSWKRVTTFNGASPVSEEVYLKWTIPVATPIIRFHRKSYVSRHHMPFSEAKAYQAHLRAHKRELGLGGMETVKSDKVTQKLTALLGRQNVNALFRFVHDYCSTNELNVSNTTTSNKGGSRGSSCDNATRKVRFSKVCAQIGTPLQKH